MKAYPVLVANLALLVAAAGGPTVFAQSAPPAKPAPSVAVTVPFVGCASDGQAGPQTAPSGQEQRGSDSRASAQRLAYYKAEYSAGVLAPRGWHCFSTYGSNGASLFVSPDPIDSKTLFSTDWKGFRGRPFRFPFRSAALPEGFKLPRSLRACFRSTRRSLRTSLPRGSNRQADFPFGPYPKDKLTYRSKSVVEFETPANTQGLGTDSRLQANASPIDGVAILSGADTDLILLSARLSAKDRDLIPLIVQQVESEAAVEAQ